jgi:hypothetical protein
MLRADITEKEHLELRVLAARKQVTGSELVARALRTSPVTRDAFKEEASK